MPLLCLGQSGRGLEELKVHSSAHWLDLDYVGDGHIGHRLDVHLPESGESPFPAVVAIYGSAWLSNNWKGHTFTSRVGQKLLGEGFAVVSINYRNSGDALFPAQLQDVKAAIRYIRGNATAFGIDPDRIGVTGWSSGGHLAAMAGTTSGLKAFQTAAGPIDLEGELGRYTDQSSHVSAVVDWFGPTDFLLMDGCGSTMEHDAGDSPESKLIGGPIQDLPDLARQADPATYVHRAIPPFLIFHGDQDPLVPHCQSEHLQQVLEENGARSELHIIPGGKHGPGVMIDRYYDAMVQFFKTHL